MSIAFFLRTLILKNICERIFLCLEPSQTFMNQIFCEIVDYFRKNIQLQLFGRVVIPLCAMFT